MRGADERDEIRARINIVDLVGQSVLLKRAGKSWKGLCPFHADKNPSFTVDPTFGTYRCWSCGEHGDVFTWVMKTRRVDFAEAIQFLAEQAGITLSSRSAPTSSKSDRARWASAMQEALAFFRENLRVNEEAQSYCERRGLSSEILSEWEIGYSPDVGDALANHLKKKGFSLAECKDLFLVDQDSVGGYFDKFRGRLMFPIRSESGDLVAFGGRLLGDGHPKYINSGDTPLYRKSRLLYGMHRAKDAVGKDHRAVLVEGYLDVIACHAAGIKTAVASLGTALTEDHARLLKRWCDQVVVLYDSDEAGQKAADRAIELLQAEGLRARVAVMPAGQDPDTLLRTKGPAAVQQAVEKNLRPLEYRVQKIRADMKPEDDSFWVAVIDALSTATNEMELDRYVVEFAQQWPGVQDAVSAQKALRREVARFKRQKKSAPPDQALPRPMNPMRSVSLHPSEIAIFKGLLEPGLRQLAWSVCGEQDLFATVQALAVAEAIRSAFPDGPPTEKPSVWVGQIEPEEARETFTVAQYDSRVERLTPQFLEDAVSSLRALRHTRELQDSKRHLEGDDRLRDVYRKLKERQGKDNLEAS